MRATMKTYPTLLFLLSIFMKQTTCFIWENEVLDVISSMNQAGEGNLTEKFMNVTQLIRSCGFAAEEHEVKTKDGYQLLLVRIPRPGAPAVFCMHGLINSADDWITVGCSRSLATQLARAKYDVWLGNARGNKYCKRNVQFSTADPRFWNFTFHEIGYYDLPAMIDYVLLNTGRARLSYVGQSQGTTVFFVLTSLRPEYNQKVSVMVSLATIAWMSHARSPVLRALAPLVGGPAVASQLSQFEVFPSSPLNQLIFRDVCTSSPLALLLCYSVLFLLYGLDYGQLDAVQSQVTIAHFPAGGSFKQLVHYAQLVQSGAFRQFDYGRAGNLLAYGCHQPPAYPVGNITTPMALFHGDNDFLSDLRDVNIFAKNAPSVFKVQRVEYERFNHMDHMWAKFVSELLYVHVITVIKEKGDQ